MFTFESFYDFFDRLCGAKGARGIISSMMLIIISVSLLYFYENYTRHFLLNRMAKEVDLLHNLERLIPEDSHGTNTELIAAHKSEIISLISSKNYSAPSLEKENIVKYFTNYSLSMLYWAVFAAAMRKEEKKKKENDNSAIVVIFFGMFLSFITSFFKRRFLILGHLIFYPTFMIIAVTMVTLIIALPFIKNNPKKSDEGSEKKGDG